MNALLPVPVWGQVAAPSGVEWLSLPVVLAVLGVACFLFMIVVVVAGARGKARRIELLHEQRMKALELGRVSPEDDPRRGTGRATAILIGLGVPTVVFGAALVFSLVNRETNWVGFSQTHMAWTAAGSVSLAAVICGTILALMLPGRVVGERSHFNPPPVSARPVKDRMSDPDALDVHHG